MKDILDHTCPLGHNIRVEVIPEADFAELPDGRAIAYRDPATGVCQLLSRMTGKKRSITPAFYSQLWARIVHHRKAPELTLAA